MCKRSCQGSGHAGVSTGLLLACVLVVGLSVAAIVLRGVFSLHGLLFTFGLASGAGLPFAPAVRVVTLLGLFELGVLTAMLLDYREGRRHLELRWAWLVAHGTL